MQAAVNVYTGEKLKREKTNIYCVSKVSGHYKTAEHLGICSAIHDML